MSAAAAQSLRQVAIAHPVEPGKVVAIGFLGAWERWDDPNRSVRKVALGLRSQGIESESFANHRLGTAKKAVIAALDRNGNKRIDPDEAKSARVVIYGQSMGGAATLKLARFLESQKVPVLLTVQVDSFGLRDSVVPRNVKVAANYYQNHLFTVRGQKKIRAADPTRTQILGNFEFDYPLWKVHTWPESWPRRIFGGAHARMEADPLLWAKVEQLILQAAQSAEVPK
ncbi:MAG: hypothetical protein FJW32_03860 [Acidobacteria bacterium]|nr:hypothetical protein [Acidobacteriota bacterium]